MESTFRKALIALLACFIVPAALHAVDVAPSVGDSGSSLAGAPSEAAKQLEKEGKLLAAQKAYEELLKQDGWDKTTANEIRKSYEALNLKLLFSKEEMPGSIQHTVVAGDNLYDLSRKYKTTMDLIRKSNGIKNDVIYAGKKLKIINGPFFIKVDKSRNLLFLFLDDKLIKSYRVATGFDSGTPVGEFKIQNKVENPAWYKPGKVVKGGSKENELGSRWLGFDNPGYGIHGTLHPESIGKQVTSGCVRMFNKDVEELYLIVPLGTQVKIVD